VRVIFLAEHAHTFPAGGAVVCRWKSSFRARGDSSIVGFHGTVADDFRVDAACCSTTYSAHEGGGNAARGTTIETPGIVADAPRCRRIFQA